MESQELKSQLFLLQLCMFVVTIGDALIIPILPPEGIKRKVSESQIGLILSSHPLFCILISFYLGLKMQQYEKKNFLLLGIFLQGFGYSLMGSAFYIKIENKRDFILINVVGRIVSGIGTTFVQNPIYSMISIMFQQNKVQKLAWMEVLQGLGFAFGFVFSSILFKLGGYVFPFIVCLIIQVILFPFIYKKIPLNRQIEEIFQKSKNLTIKQEINYEMNQIQNQSKQNQELDKQVEDKIQLINNLKESKNRKFSLEKKELLLDFLNQDLEQNSFFQKEQNNISYRQIFSYTPSLILIIILFTQSTNVMFLYPSLSNFLMENLNISESNTGYFFSISSFSYMFFSSQLPRFKLYLNSKQLITISLTLETISYLLYGPAPFIPFKQNIPLMVILRILVGLSHGLFIPGFIAELYDEINDFFPQLNESILADKCSAIFNSMWHLGQIFGPIIGGVCVQEYGFQASTMFLAFIQILLFFAYTKQHKNSIQSSLS